jgi:hypothetical protein
MTKQGNSKVRADSAYLTAWESTSSNGVFLLPARSAPREGSTSQHDGLTLSAVDGKLVGEDDGDVSQHLPQPARNRLKTIRSLGSVRTMNFGPHEQQDGHID